ncbi:lysophospholipid acyltransferase family protein [Patulibacter sp. NPDC049589]|uniref:lysophospholipid acyltransferase family protein n=1 Tax=Patulibacter sp. NPDC049589 TaxID=3154731 RepID=UPI00341EFE85
MAADDVPPIDPRTERMTPMYRAVMVVAGGIVKHWGRLEVEGLEHLPDGPLLLIGNHDSNWDPVAIGKAGEPRRQIRALAKSTLWKTKPLAFVMNGMGQIPVRRGQNDAHALDKAIAELASGACIGVFPEGTISRGTYLRPRSGAGRLAQAVPAATVVCVTVTGTVDLIRFPLRPRIAVRFFPPRGGQIGAGEEPGAFMVRVVEEIRERAPVAIPGRCRTAEKLRRAAEQQAAEAPSAPDARADGDLAAPAS